MPSPHKSSSPSPVLDDAEENTQDVNVPIPSLKDSASEIQPENRAPSAPAECAVEVPDLERGAPQPEEEGPVAKDERDCRICHLSLVGSNQDPIELGCACKDDLAAAHKQCAEAWFKIKGNLTCEICGSVACNVSVADNDSEPLHRWDIEAPEPTAVITIPVIIQPRQSRNFWPGHRFLNFLLACMVFAFIISWLFHFNFPS
ncbi:hypothetical protein CDL15_Pgr022560 [Punica granatum]|nr:hypothetical protein CDL15_Pgr022560 [Punica granatum]PKI46630.1 hypothetical protein CRG98_032972 [Punica granatum]